MAVFLKQCCTDVRPCSSCLWSLRACTVYALGSCCDAHTWNSGTSTRNFEIWEASTLQGPDQNPTMLCTSLWGIWCSMLSERYLEIHFSNVKKCRLRFSFQRKDKNNNVQRKHWSPIIYIKKEQFNKKQWKFCHYVLTLMLFVLLVHMCASFMVLKSFSRVHCYCMEKSDQGIIQNFSKVRMLAIQVWKQQEGE